MILGSEYDPYLRELEYKEEYSYPEHRLAYTQCIRQILKHKVAEKVCDASQESYEEVQAQGEGPGEVQLPINPFDHKEVQSGEGRKNECILEDTYL